MSLEKHLRKLKIDEAVIQEIVTVKYPPADDPKQNFANFMASAMQKSEELLDYDTISEVMFDRACCKNGFRLNNARQFAKEHTDKTLEERLALLGELKYMGKPFLNTDGDIETIAVGSPDSGDMTCPCWHFQGALPSSGPMPLSYCKCCAGHFRFHYQKALGLQLRLKEVVSSILNSKGNLPCVFIYEVVSGSSNG